MPKHPMVESGFNNGNNDVSSHEASATGDAPIQDELDAAKQQRQEPGATIKRVGEHLKRKEESPTKDVKIRSIYGRQQWRQGSQCTAS